MLAYTSYGDGVPVVLLHGFCENQSMWDDFAPLLVSQGVRVLTPDLPGFGDSVLSQRPVSMESMAKEVYDWLEALDIQACVLIGHSMGGYVALAFASLFPEKLTGLGLFHSTAMADSDQRKELRNRTIEFVREKGVEVFGQSFVAPLFYPKHRKKNQDAINKMISVACSTPVETLVAATEAMRDRQDYTCVLDKLTIPVMFIVGKDDQSVVLESSVAQLQMPKEAHILMLAEVAHMGMFEQKEACVDAIRGFVARCLNVA